jgi:hypothetical protein
MKAIKYSISFSLFAVFMFFCLNNAIEAKTGYSVQIENSLNKVRLGDPKYQADLPASDFIAEIKLAKGEYEAFQIILNSGPSEIKDINIVAANLKGKKGGVIGKENIEIFIERYIYVSKFTDSPGWYPDALMPFDDLDLKSNTIQPLWVSVYAPSYTAADEYEGPITIKSPDSEDLTLTLKVTVWDFSLPATPNLRTSFVIQSGFISERHSISPQNPEFKRLLKNYNENALRHRVSPERPSYPDITEKNDTVSVNFDNFDEEMQHYLDLGLNSFNVFWHKFPSAAVKVSSDPLKDDKITNRTSEILRITEEHLMEQGWLDLSYVSLVDEPRKEYFPQVKERYSFLKDCAPNIKRLLTLEYWAWDGVQRPAYKDLAGYVDIWTVLPEFYDKNFLQDRQKKNDEIWWYLSCGSKRPYANFWAIDYPGIDHRIIFWQAWKYDITGLLYWSINFWKANVWDDPVSYTGTNGDGSLIYWGAKGPVNSIRWEIVRDGVEDYDYFCILRKVTDRLRNKDKDKKYTELVNRSNNILDISDLSPSLTSYTKESQKLLDRREKIGDLIIEINRAIKMIDQDNL